MFTTIYGRSDYGNYFVSIIGSRLAEMCKTRQPVGSSTFSEPVLLSVNYYSIYDFSNFI